MFCCNANSEKLFSRNRFLSFIYAPIHYLYDVAYRNNEFYRSLILNFLLVILLQQCVGSFFCFLLSEVDGDRFAITTDSSALKKLVVSN